MVASLLASFAGNSWASERSYFDAYYVPRFEFNVTSNEDHGDGYGARVQIPVWNGLRVTGEYEAATLNDTGFDITQYRYGLLFMGGDHIRLGAGAAEIRPTISTSLSDFKPDGYSLYLRGELDVTEGSSLYAQAGYRKLRPDANADGPEYVFGGTAMFTSILGAFGEYRLAALKDDDGARIEFADIRVGVRARFNGL